MENQGVFPCFLIVIVVKHATLKKQLLENWLAPKKGAIFSLIYFFKSFCIYYIPHNYVIPQAMPHAIPQTHSSFYPLRFCKTAGLNFTHIFNPAGLYDQFWWDDPQNSDKNQSFSCFHVLSITFQWECQSWSIPILRKSFFSPSIVTKKWTLWRVTWGGCSPFDGSKHISKGTPSWNAYGCSALFWPC